MDRFERGDVVLVVDVFTDFGHDDGDRLLESFRDRVPNMSGVLDSARAADVPVVYANDERGRWRSEAPRLIREALDGKSGELIAPLAPDARDFVLPKHRYSAFDHTALDVLLGSMHVDRVILVGAATESCVVHAAIDARERGGPSILDRADRGRDRTRGGRARARRGPAHRSRPAQALTRAWALDVDAELAEVDDRGSAPPDRVGGERQHEGHPVGSP